MRVIFIILVISQTLFAQMGDPKNRLIGPKIGNQTDLAKKQIPKYLKQLPKKIMSCASHYLKASNYYFLLANGGEKVLSKVFKYTSHRRTPTTENQFAFGYGEIDEVCPAVYNYCRGYTESKVLWNRMSYYINDISQYETIFNTKVPTDKSSKEWHDFYFQLIDNVFDKREVAVIPGFKNLYEFSKSTPHIQRYLKEHIALMWAKKNIGFSGLFKILRSIYNKFDYQEALTLHKDLDYKINTLGYNPIVFVTNETRAKEGYSLPANASIHVMQAFKVTPIDQNGQYKIHFWDVGTPHDARNAPSIYPIQTKDNSSKNNTLLSSPPTPIVRAADKRTAGDVYNFSFGDIEQTPFDDLFVGDDAVRIIKFFDQNPSFLNYLESKYIERINNPPRPFYPPYEGAMDYIPKLVLKDGSHWQWTKEHLNINGDIHIDKYFVENIDPAVAEVIEYFHPKWKTYFSLPNNFQAPTTLVYTSPDNNVLTYEWPLEWLRYDGVIELPDNFKQTASADLIKFLEDSYLNFNFKTIESPKYLNTDQRTIDLGDDAVIVKMEFIDNEGRLVIPKKYLSQVPKKLKDFLINVNSWPLKQPISIEGLNRKEFLSNGKQKWLIPPAYFVNPWTIQIPEGAEKDWPKWVREIFCGYGPYTKCQKKYYLNDLEIFRYNIMKDGEIKDYINLPISWADRYFNTTDPSFSSPALEVIIPENQIDYIPQKLKDIISGVGGEFPPSKTRFGSFGRFVVLKDGSYFHFPLSWLSNKFEGHYIKYVLEIPQGQEHIIPEQVKDQIFSKGPYQLKPNKKIEFLRLQFVMWYTPEGSGKALPLIIPSQWMTKDDKAVVPSQEEIDKYFTPIEQDFIKETHPGFAPGYIFGEDGFNDWPPTDDKLFQLPKKSSQNNDGDFGDISDGNDPWPSDDLGDFE